MGQLIHGDAVQEMGAMADGSVEMILTSPPYGTLRDYTSGTGAGYRFPFGEIASQCARVLAVGGVMVWVVADMYANGGRTLDSMRQALHFQRLGLTMHDIIIWDKGVPAPRRATKRYMQAWEYMFVMCRGAEPRTANLLTEPCAYAGASVRKASIRQMDGSKQARPEYAVPNERRRTNVWRAPVGWMKSTPDKVAYEHPAIMPDRLAEWHIASWTNPGDTVLDPMGGSGTTAVAAKRLGRDWIYIDRVADYCDIARQRLAMPVPVPNITATEKPLTRQLSMWHT